MPSLKLKKSNSEENDNIIAAIIAAVGKHKGFSSKAIREYANAVAKELPYASFFGSNRATLSNDWKALVSAVSNAEKAFKTLSSLTANNSECGFQHSYVANEMRLEISAETHFETQFEPFLENDNNMQHDIECCLSITQEYLKRFRENLQNTHLPKNQRGPNNKATLAPAIMLAAQYAKYFNEMPTYSKHFIEGNRDSSKRRETPYDRVCAVVAKYYEVEISESTRKQAIVSAKKLDKK